MAKYGSDDVSFILIDGYQLAGYLLNLSDSQKAVLERSDTLGDGWVEHTFVGLCDFNLVADGFYDDADNASNEAFIDQYSVRTICYGVEGNTTGNQLIMLYGPVQAKYERQATKGTLHKAKIELPGSGEVERGAIIAPLTARTTAGDTESTPVDNTSDSASGGAVYLQVTSLTLGGYTNLIVNLRHSQDDVTYATKQAFTAVTAAPAKERYALTGDIYRYAAVSWTWTGSGSDQTATFLVGLHRN